MKRRTRFTRRESAGLAAGLLTLSAAPLTAQAPPLVPPAPPVTAPTAPGPMAAPPATVPPVITPPASAPTRTLTLDQVLAIALNNNSSVRLSREKVFKAQQLITEANAGGLPQVRVDVVDTLSSNKTFGTAAGGSNSTGTLPGGGQIPVIIDQGGGNTGAVTSSGGGGTATGAGSSSLSTVNTNSSGSGGTGGSGSVNTTPTNSTFGTGGTTGTGGTGTGGAGTGATGTGGGFGTTGPTIGIGGGTTSHVRSSGLDPADLPPIMQSLETAAKGQAGPKQARAVSPRDGGTGTGTGTGTGQQPGNGSFNTGNSGYNNNYSARLSITQGIDLFRLVPAAQDVERLTSDFYATDLNRIQNETALSVKDQFFNVLRDQAQVAVYAQQVAADTESVRVTQARVTAGAAAQYDLLTAQTTLSNAQQQLSSARNTLTLAQVNLNNLLGVGADEVIGLEEPPVPPLNQAFSTPQLTQTAFARRPELHQADNNVLIAQRLIKLAGVSLLPSLSVVGSGNYNGHVSGSSPHDTVSLSAVLGIPLYDGGTTRAKVREAQSDLRSQEITRDQLRQNVSIEIRQALSNINDAQTRAASAGVGVTQAQEAYRLATVRYQNGIGTILDEVNAQAQLAQARTNLLNAQYDYQTSLAQLVRAIGGR